MPFALWVGVIIIAIGSLFPSSCTNNVHDTMVDGDHFKATLWLLF